MELWLNRVWISDKSSSGVLRVDGQMECYTLEDIDRELEKGGEKVPGKTAIPKGRYRVILDLSRRFQRVLPRLLNVPQFTGVRIHSGNKVEDTEGCILVGRFHRPDFVGESKLALESLMMKIIGAIDNKDEVWIVVS